MTMRAAAISCIYALAVFTGLFHHELWADEAQHFLLALKSKSINELFYNCRWEGHPPLWNLLLYLLTRFTAAPFAMQALNGIIGVLSVFLFCRYSPFSWYTRIVFSFGYFSLFEFGIISRSYSLLLLFIVVYCIVSLRRSNGYGIKFFILLLLSSTHLFGMMAALALLASELIKEKKHINLLFLVGSLVSFTAIAVAFIIPPKGHMLVALYNNHSFFSPERIKKVGAIPVKAFIHIPDFTRGNLWNRDIIITYFPFAGGALSMFLLILPYFLFKEWRLRVLFYGAFLLLSAFAFISPLMVAERHASVIMLVFLTCCWLSASRQAERFLKIFATIQLFGGVIMFHADYERPFSNGKYVAEYLKANVPWSVTIAVSNQGSGSPISLYLERDVYYPEKNGFGSFAEWNTIPFLLPDSAVYERLGKLPVPFYLILNHKPHFIPAGYTPVAAFESSIVSSEDYYVFKVQK